MEAKGIHKSKTIAGVVVAILGLVLGWNPELQTLVLDQAVEGVDKIIGLVGMFTVLYARVKDGSKLDFLPKGKGEAKEGYVQPRACMALVVAFVIALSVIGCSGAGSVKPSGPCGATALAEASYESLVRMATKAHASGLMDVALTDKLNTEFHSARVYLNAAGITCEQGDAMETGRWVNLATELLNAAAQEVPR